MAERAKNTAASVKQRLRNKARETGQDFQALLIAFALERLVYRLSVSKHRNSFVLKGGMLVTVWTVDPGRFTKDLDFLAFGEDDEAALKSVFKEILSPDAEDGLVFDGTNLTSAQIREDQVYGGMRLKTTAYLERTRIPIVIDIGFGDALAEPEYEIEYPSTLDYPRARIRAYSPETVMAEKLHAMVALGAINGRMKDYYDLWALPNSIKVDPTALEAAIKSTFARRETRVPNKRPIGLSQSFAEDAQKQAQWAAYAESIDRTDLHFPTVVEEIWHQVGPVLQAAAKSKQ